MTILADPIVAADARPAVTLLAANSRSADAARLLAIAGARVGRPDNLPSAAFLGQPRALFVDLRDMAADERDAALDRLDGGELPVVAVIADAQLDALAGSLLGAGRIVLCDPSPSECVAAIAIALAGEGSAPLHDASRDAARIDRLNDEVARIAETLARLAGREPPEREALLGDRRIAFGTPPQAAGAADSAEIRRTIRARRMRTELFGIDGLFEDPAWDMLLDLFAARLEHRQVSVSSLCIAAAVAPTTALRWIGKLIDAGLLERRPDSFDRRRAFIVLTDRAADAMTNYVAAVKRAGLPLA